MWRGGNSLQDRDVFWWEKGRLTGRPSCGRGDLALVQVVVGLLALSSQSLSGRRPPRVPGWHSNVPPLSAALRCCAVDSALNFRLRERLNSAFGGSPRAQFYVVALSTPGTTLRVQSSSWSSNLGFSSWSCYSPGLWSFWVHTASL